MNKRQKQAKLAAAARWGKQTLAEGVLALGGTEIDCYVLETKERVIATPSLLSALNMATGGYKTGERRILRFVNGQHLSPYVSDELRKALTNPMKIKTKEGNVALAYPSSVLPDLCSAVIKAANENSLQPQQQHIAKQAQILLNGFANIGVVGLIDEATGYQYERERSALQTIMERFIAKEAADWIKTFPDDYYKEMFRLQGMSAEELHRRPKSFAGYTNNIIYRRLAPNIVEELHKRNPKKANGTRNDKNHQWLTRNKGYPALMLHLGKVIAMMQASRSWDNFMKRLDKHLPVYPAVVVEVEEKGVENEIE